MAQNLPVPRSPGDLAGRAVPVVNVIEWLFETWKTINGLLGPVASIDAKLSLLIGDDTRRTFIPEIFPEWLQDMIAGVTETNFNPLDGGVLAHNETDSVTGEKHWVPLYSILRNNLFWLTQSLRDYAEINAPYYHRTPQGILRDGDMFDSWSTIEGSDPNEVQLSSVVIADAVHVMASLAGLLSIADRIPIPAIGLGEIARGTGEGSPTFHGSIAEIVASQEQETFTRLQRWRQSSMAAPQG